MWRVLALLLFGCSSRAEEQFINRKDIVYRNELAYLINSKTPFTGTITEFHNKEQKGAEDHYKDGKRTHSQSWYKNGALRSKTSNLNNVYKYQLWYRNGQKELENTMAEGKTTNHYWDKKGRPL